MAVRLEIAGPGQVRVAAREAAHDPFGGQTNRIRIRQRAERAQQADNRCGIHVRWIDGDLNTDGRMRTGRETEQKRLQIMTLRIAAGVGRISHEMPLEKLEDVLERPVVAETEAAVRGLRGLGEADL